MAKDKRLKGKKGMKIKKIKKAKNHPKKKGHGKKKIVKKGHGKELKTKRCINSRVLSIQQKLQMLVPSIRAIGDGTFETHPFNKRLADLQFIDPAKLPAISKLLMLPSMAPIGWTEFKEYALRSSKKKRDKICILLKMFEEKVDKLVADVLDKPQSKVGGGRVLDDRDLPFSNYADTGRSTIVDVTPYQSAAGYLWDHPGGQYAGGEFARTKSGRIATSRLTR